MTQTLTSPGGSSLAIAGGRNAPIPAPHGKEPPDTPFATVLDDHQARTAIAEGHQQKRQAAARGPVADGDERERAIDRDGDAARDDADTAPADPTSTEASALAALLGGVPLPAGVELTATAIAPLPQGDLAAMATSPKAASRVLAGLPASSAAAPAVAPAAPTAPMPTGPAVPADASALPLRPPIPAAIGADIAPGVTGGMDAEASLDQLVPAPAATAGAAAARATRLADVLQSATARPTGLGTSATTTTTTTPAGTGAAATPPAATVAGNAARSFGQATDQGAANGSAPQPLSPALPQTQSTAPMQGGTPIAATAPAHGVGLEHAVETVRLALRAAADRGVTHARISLTPRELGSIEVHLRQTADGLVARVVAEHATAAQLLHNAGGELRRQLESQGLTLLRLDIGAGDQGDRAADRQALANGGGSFGDAGSSRHRRGADADQLAPLDATDPTSTTTTLALPNGALVDVLA